ncbi:serine protease snake [Plutella xylostella]|uniref:serine protease snake n=1 Tax=Plutella xylostella TaxID=51655 RepID=UPI002032BB2C|nr:serine protease snake [Plutella xylostella]
MLWYNFVLLIGWSAAQNEDRWSWGVVEESAPDRTTVATVTRTTASTITAKFQADNSEPVENKNTWGYVNVTEVTDALQDTAAHDVCAPFNAPVPNYSAPHRRTIQVKCYEYIWLIKYREQTILKNEACKRHRLNLPKDVNPPSGERYTYQGEFPHMGIIGWKEKEGDYIFMCAGSLISAKFVITAAHCTNLRVPRVEKPTPDIVRFGDRSIVPEAADAEFTVESKIHRIIIHPNYKHPKLYDDIALLELEKETAFTKFIQPACLYHKADISKLYTKMKVTTWGWQIESSDNPKQKVAVFDMVDDSNCDRMLTERCNRRWCGLKNQLCVVGDGDRDTCQGDSGGPLQVEIPLPTSQGKIHYVIGIFSFASCGRSGAPAVNTRVAGYLDWIESIVWPSS